MPKRVLVVDDDPAQRRILEETIKRFGYSVATAESGDKALAALRADAASDICLVLLDLVMPGTDGMAVLGAMRALPKKPPTIVQTAHGSIDAAIAAMRAGAIDFVVKPVSPERLEVSIKNALKIEALAGELNRIKSRAKGSLGASSSSVKGLQTPPFPFSSRANQASARS
jgi:DNA-binding NtrC family response regulator